MKKYCAVFRAFIDTAHGSHHSDDASFPYEYEEIEADNLEEAEKLAQGHQLKSLTGGRALISIKALDG